MDNILPLVERPSRYLGTEINRIYKDADQVKLKIALAFPDLYEIGTSHFGLQILYHILNQQPHIAAERVFAPAQDMAALLSESRTPLQTLESKRPLREFDIIGFSLLYELNYTNILSMLDLAGIPFYTTERDSSFPIIIAGGPCMANPEPIADFFDAILVGDGEEAVLEMADDWIQWKKVGGKTKEDLLHRWAAIPGVYIPSLFVPTFDSSGAQTLTAKCQVYQKVHRAIVSDLDTAAFPQNPVIPFGRPVHDRLRLEVARGCTRGCRFCQAGMIYRPVRERKASTLLKISQKALAATGYEDLSLLSLSTGDYCCIEELLLQLSEYGAHNHVAISLPSLRADTLTPELMKLVQRVRKTGFTIAPEAGSQRLRDVINKNISREEIFYTVKEAFELGWKVIKLYFMVGLPTETSSDLKELVDLVRELRAIKPSNKTRGRKGSLNVSVATFIPKPHTPFQWASQLTLSTSQETITSLRKQLDLSGVHFKWQNPQVSLIEGLFSRGDRSFSRLLTTAYRLGCRFDGWSDQFRFDLWQQAINDTQINVDFYIHRSRDTDESLPWDHIDSGVSKEYLKTEWHNALNGKPTLDCRLGDCNNCGVCDFEQVFPITHAGCPAPLTLEGSCDSKKREFKTFRLIFSKKGPAKYFGHLEMVNIFLRAVRRAGFDLKYSPGFHPMPKISFEDSLPIGLESLVEVMYLTTRTHVDPAEIPVVINRQLPDGLEISGCELVAAKVERPDTQFISYQVALKTGLFDSSSLKCFNEKSSFIFKRLGRRGNLKTIDLKEAVSDLTLLSENTITLTIKSTTGMTLRPMEVIAEVFELSPERARQLICVKTDVSH